MLPYISLRQRFTVLQLNNRRLQYNRACLRRSVMLGFDPAVFPFSTLKLTTLPSRRLSK